MASMKEMSRSLEAEGYCDRLGFGSDPELWDDLDMAGVPSMLDGLVEHDFGAVPFPDSESGNVPHFMQ